MSTHSKAASFSGSAAAVGKDLHLFDTQDGPHLLLVDGSQIFQIDAELARQLAGVRDDEIAHALLAEHGLGLQRFIDDEPLADPPLRALSLTVAERCNLGCTYCYAEGGSFGGPARQMDWEVARAAVVRLFAETKRGERVNLAFLGGEPLVSRALIRRTTDFAAQIANERKIPIGFSITTNGTLVTADDAEFFERHVTARRRFTTGCDLLRAVAAAMTVLLPTCAPFSPASRGCKYRRG
jgi:uncharacterized protein